MKKNSILIFAFLTVFAFGVQTASAQITITIPKIPKIKKGKPQQSKSERGSDAAFDKQEFTNIKWGNTIYVDPYLECYANKHNLELIKVTGDAFSPRSFNNAKEMKQTLQAEQTKLAEIETLLKNNLRERPNTSLNYHENPAIWEEITVNRAGYLQCAIGEKESQRVSESVWLRAHLENIAKKKKEAAEYTPETKRYLVSAASYDYLLFAVSLRAREKWLKDAGAMEFKPNVDAALDDLAAAVAGKLPVYLPLPANFAFRNVAEEKMMKGISGDLTTLKIHKIGLAQANWLIDKNELGIPKARYKQGYVWVRVMSDDHPYCHLYQINIIQDYAGGGTYGASYAKFLDNNLSGCPAGQ